MIKAVFVSLIALAVATPAAAESGDEWEFGASVYGWFPDIGGDISTERGGDDDFTVDISDILSALEFTFQGSFDARKGRWGVFTDVIYMSLGATNRTSAEGSIGGEEIPVDVNAKVSLDMKSLIWTTAGYYRAIEESNRSLDLLAGVRYLDIEQKLDWTLSGNVGSIPLPGREGNAKVTADNWDFIVGVRGRFNFGDNNAWYIPYYADIGTGDSDFTYQVAAGAGRTFGWGDVTAIWRYMSYDVKSGSPITDLNFNGPAIGATFRW